jgi:nucleoside-diphosphate-sugar epimerase
VASAASSIALVTGAGGFIGSALCSRLARDGVRVRGVDRPCITRASGAHRWLGHDLARPLPADALHGVDLVAHCAALAGVQGSWTRPREYWVGNVIATRLLRAACERAGRPRVIHLSSISVYGEGHDLSEDSPARPVSPYGFSKLAAEREWRGYGPVTIVRLSNVYGPGQRPDMAYATFLRAALADERLALRDGGRQLRTPTFIGDCVEGVIGAAHRGAPGAVYNIAGPDHVRLLELPTVISELLGREVSSVAVTVAPGDPRAATVSGQRAAHELGFLPAVRLHDGLRWQLAALQLQRHRASSDETVGGDELIDHLVWDRRVGRDPHRREGALRLVGLTADGGGDDVDPVLPEHGPDAPDHAWDIAVAE